MKFKSISIMLAVMIIVNMFFTFTTFAADDGIIKLSKANVTVHSDANITVTESSGVYLYSGGWFEYTVNVSNAGQYMLKLCEACKNATAVTVNVDSDKQIDTKLPATGDLYTTNWVKYGEVRLESGDNKLKFSANAECFIYALELEYLDAERTEYITSNPMEFEIKKSTIDADKYSNVALSNSAVGFTTVNGYIDYRINTEATKSYKLSVLARDASGANTVKVASVFKRTNGNFEETLYLNNVTIPQSSSEKWSELGTIRLKAGSNIIRIKRTGSPNDLYIWKLKLVALEEDILQNTYSAPLSPATLDKAVGSIDSSVAAFSMSQDCSLEYVVNTQKLQRYKLILNSKDSSSKANSFGVYVNNVEQIRGKSVQYAGSAAWADFELGTILLKPGKNTIKIEEKSKVGNIVYMQTLKLEAVPDNEEDIVNNTMTDDLYSVTIDDYYMCVPGAGSVGLTATDAWFEYTVNTQTPGDYTLSVWAKNTHDTTSIVSVSVNGNEQLANVVSATGATSALVEKALGTISLSTGKNVIRITRNDNHNVGGTTVGVYMNKIKLEKPMSITSFSMSEETATAVISKLTENAENKIWLVISQYSVSGEVLKLEKCTLTAIDLSNEAVGEKTYTAVMEQYDANLLTKAFLLNADNMAPLAEAK